jgi:penicillin amidase
LYPGYYFIIEQKRITQLLDASSNWDKEAVNDTITLPLGSVVTKNNIIESTNKAGLSPIESKSITHRMAKGTNLNDVVSNNIQ